MRFVIGFGKKLQPVIGWNRINTVNTVAMRLGLRARLLMLVCMPVLIAASSAKAENGGWVKPVFEKPVFERQVFERAMQEKPLLVTPSREFGVVAKPEIIGEKREPIVRVSPKFDSPAMEQMMRSPSRAPVQLSPQNTRRHRQYSQRTHLYGMNNNMYRNGYGVVERPRATYQGQLPYRKNVWNRTADREW
jgi:hypothetical protein